MLVCARAVLWGASGQRARLKILLPSQCPDQGLLLVETNPGFALSPRLFYLQIWEREVGGDQIAAGWAETQPTHRLPPHFPLPSFQQKTRHSGLQELQPQVLAPLGLCQAHPFPPTSWQRHGRAICGWEPRLAMDLPASS